MVPASIDCRPSPDRGDQPPRPGLAADKRRECGEGKALASGLASALASGHPTRLRRSSVVRTGSERAAWLGVGSRWPGPRWQRRWAKTGWLIAGLGAGACSTPVASDLSEMAANEVVVALHAEGIDAEKRSASGAGARFQIWVPQGSASRALRVLVGNELPRRRSENVQQGLGGSLLPSRNQDRLRVARALGASLETSLESVDRVLQASVHVSLPERRSALDSPPASARASVLLRFRGLAPPLEPNEIRRLVSGAVEHLEEGAVAVVLKRAPEPPSPAKPARARFGPVETTAESLPWLRALTAAIASLNAAMATLLWFVWRRWKRKLSHEPP